MSSYKGAFSYSIRILQGLGLWNLESEDSFKVTLYNWYRCFALLYLFIVTLLPCIDFALSLGDVRKWSFNLCFTITAVATFIKTYGILWKLKAVNGLRRDMNRDLSKESDKNREILGGAAIEVTTLLKTLMSMGYVLFVVWITIPFTIGGELRLPLQLWLPFDSDVSPNYELTYIFHFIIGFVLVMTVFGTNNTIVGFTIRISAEYDILKNDIEQFSRQFEDSVPIAAEKAANEFREIVKHHQRIIGFVDRLQASFQLPLNVQFIGSTVLLMIIGLDIILVSSTLNMRLILQIQYIVITLTDLFLYCFYGTRLIRKSEEVAEAAFGSQWYAMPPAYRRSLAFVIKRSQKCPRIIVGRMYVINLHLYLEIIKVTYNILAVMGQLAAAQ